MASGAPDWWIQGLIPLQFLNLSDTPGDYTDKAGLVPEVNPGEGGLEWSDAKIDAHKSRHVVGGADALAHSDLNPSTSDHHVRFSAAEARAAINGIFGADGLATKQINLAGFTLVSGQVSLGPMVSAGLTHFTQNAYIDIATWRYRGDGYAVLFQMSDADGTTKIYTAPTGLTDGAISWTVRLTLDVSGNLTTVATYDGINLSKPIMIGPHAFVPRNDAYDWNITNDSLANRTSTASRSFYANIQMPHGKTVSEVKLYGYREDGDAVMSIVLRRNDMANSTDEMGTVIANWTSGWSSLADTGINNAVIDNDTYSYFLVVTLDPNDAVGDVEFSGCKISFA